MKKKPSRKTISNKKARFDYEIGETIVAGIVLTGAETKSLRMGHAILQGSFVMVKDNELWLNNCQINPLPTNLPDMPEDERQRPRKLLVTRKQLEELAGEKRKGLNIIPIKFLTASRHIKVELGIGRGKKKYDKRQTIKKRDQERDARREVHLKISTWNVNGIRAVWGKGLFQKFIEEHDPDILCLQETKAQQHQSPVDLPHYHEYWHSAEKKGYSGTAIFSKTEPLEVRNGFSPKVQKAFNFVDKFGDPTKEGRVISARFKDFWVITVYTPNSKDKLERLELRHKVWDPAFLMHIKELEAEAPVLFSGDFNVAHKEIDLARPKDNVGHHGFTVEEREGFGKMIEAGFLDTFRIFYPDTTEAYTWWTAWGGARERNVGWRIDYWMTSPKLAKKVTAAAIHPDVMGSDHCPVSIELSL